MNDVGITVFEGLCFAIAVHTLKCTQTFKMYVLLLFKSGITHITSEAAGLTVLHSTSTSEGHQLYTDFI
jgi:hypothetical protein